MERQRCTELVGKARYVGVVEVRTRIPPPQFAEQGRRGLGTSLRDDRPRDPFGLERQCGRFRRRAAGHERIERNALHEVEHRGSFAFVPGLAMDERRVGHGPAERRCGGLL